MSTSGLIASKPAAARPTTVAELVDLTPDLPSVPTVALATHRETGRAGATASSVAAIVETDPALTVRVLRLANSAFYGNARNVASVGDAVRILGMRSVQNLCLLAGTYPWLSGGMPAYGLAPGALMTHSLACALSAQTLARRAGVDGEAAFSAGLLHDLGKAALSRVLRPADGPMRGPEDERRAVGFDHAQVGAELARRWNLPIFLVGSIACHHLPCEPHEDVVHVGDAVAYLLQEGPAPTPNPGSLERLSLTADDLPEIADSIRMDFLNHLKLAGACA